MLEWNGEPQPICVSEAGRDRVLRSNWVELHKCQVISHAWDGVFVKNQALKDALQPIMRLAISFSSGLRVPQVSAWLEGHSPQVTIFGFSPTVELQMVRLSDNHKVLEKSQSTNTPIAVNFTTPGDYLVEASCAGESSERFIRIVDWSWLSIEKPERREVTPIASGHQICGSVIEQVSEPT